MITAFDIGGSTIKSASVGGYDAIKPLAVTPTPAKSFDDFVAAMRHAINQSPLPTEVVSASITGVINKNTGVAKVANIPCIDNRQLVAELHKALDVPVIITNDANCFTLAEAKLGAGRGHTNVFGIILGTGVGGGLVINNKLLEGPEGFAGEWGHGPSISTSTPFWPNPIPNFLCGCGQAGCIDTIGGARGMEKLHAFLHNVPKSSQEITKNWLAGDEQSQTTIHVLVDLISGPLAMLMNVLGITIAPVGGGLSKVPELVDLLDIATRKKMLCAPSLPLIVPHQCEIEPGLAGAAILGLEKHHVS